MSKELHPSVIASAVVLKQHPRPSDVLKTSAYHVMEGLTKDHQILWEFDDWLKKLPDCEDMHGCIVRRITEMTESGEVQKQKKIDITMEGHLDQMGAMSAVVKTNNRPLSLTEEDLDSVYVRIREVAPAVIHQRMHHQTNGNCITPEKMPGLYAALARSVASGAVFNVVHEATRKHFSDLGLLSQHRVEFDEDTSGHEKSELEKYLFLKKHVEEVLYESLNMQKY